MTNYELTRGAFTLSTDKTKLDVPLIHDYLCNQSYWAQGRPLEAVQTSIEHSLCFGIYQESAQVAFCRVVSDYATFAWLCDVFVLEAVRGHGLGKWLIESVMAYPEVETVRRVLLATRDAHELYRQYGGFENLPAPERWMIRLKPTT
jgi:GNAT superfamily N-acetyltransferase